MNKLLLNMSMISAVAGVSSCRATTDTDLPSTLQNTTATKTGEHITEASQNELWLFDESDVNEEVLQNLGNDLSESDQEELPVPYNSRGVI